jgi:hypothetical protein
MGAHLEGLDHVWLLLENGIPIRSWADGRVTKIEDMGGGEFFITIAYDGGLSGKHMEVKTPLVSVGQQVKAGDPVAYGLIEGSAQSAEFMLNDKNRNDGSTADNDGSYVSPFDYLRADIRDSLELIYREKVIQPYLSVGRDAGNNRRAEPYLTNQVLIHRQHKGTIAGEWLLRSKWAPGGHPDIITLLDSDNEFYKGKRIVAADDVSEGQLTFDGTWSADTVAHTFTFTNGSAVYYGLYELNEISERASLKIEYRIGSLPASFSPAAGQYIERGPYPRRIDADALGVR